MWLSCQLLSIFLIYLFQFRKNYILKIRAEYRIKIVNTQLIFNIIYIVSKLYKILGKNIGTVALS